MTRAIKDLETVAPNTYHWHWATVEQLLRKLAP